MDAKFRSACNQMQIALLCRSAYIKHFGLQTILRPLINELKEISTVGFRINNAVHKARLLYVCGDHLGHHSIGVFQTNFSSGYFCEFCSVTMAEIRDKSISVSNSFPCRSKEEYSALCESNQFGQLGIVRPSILNEVPGFHILDQLLPCLGHDWFEGVVAEDLLLVLKYLCKNKWFTFNQLNKTIKTFQFASSDSKNRPATINPDKKKLSGSASQIWTLLRFLHLFIDIKDEVDEHWKLAVLAQSITELLTAHSITKAQISILHSYILEYLHERRHLFPDVHLKPKHHFLTHYPRFILRFGPPINFWTMCFESKHSFFKKCARSSANFKNITKTLSTFHQELQASYTYRSYFNCLTSSTYSTPIDYKIVDDCVANFTHYDPIYCRDQLCKIYRSDLLGRHVCSS